MVLSMFTIVLFILPNLVHATLGAKLAVLPAFLIRQKLFLANRVVTRLFVFINLSGIEKPLQHSLNDSLVARIDRLRPCVVFHIELFPKIDKLLGDAFDEFRRWKARFGR